MLFLSNYSLRRILHCLNWKSAPDTLDSFGKSCNRINEQICAIGMDKAENVVLSITSTCSRETTVEKDIYSVITEIGFKETCDDICPDCPKLIPRITQRLPNDIPRSEPQPRWPPLRERLTGLMRDSGLGHIPYDKINEYMNPDERVLKNEYYRLDDTNRCSLGSITHNVAKKVVALEKSPSTEYFLERIYGAFNRLRSVSTLKLSGWRIDENVFRCLMNHPKLKFLREIYLEHCVLTITKDLFLEFLHSKQIKEIHANSRFRGFLIDDSCLLEAEKIYLTGMNEVKRGAYPGITDNLLKQWIEKPPIEVAFITVSTTFTLAGLIELLKASAAANSQAHYSLSSTVIAAEEISLLFRATQEVRTLVWRIVYNQDEYWDVSCHIKNNDKFYFSITLEIPRTENDLAEEAGPSGGPDKKKAKITKKERKPRNTPKNKATIQTQTRITRSTSK